MLKSMQLMNKYVFLQIFLVHESNHLKRIHITLLALEYSLITILLNILIQTNSNEIIYFLVGTFTLLAYDNFSNALGVDCLCLLKKYTIENM